jgi:ribosomal protein L37AE/L43A
VLLRAESARAAEEAEALLARLALPRLAKRERGAEGVWRGELASSNGAALFAITSGRW